MGLRPMHKPEEIAAFYLSSKDRVANARCWRGR
jgi:hypothetical protein